MKGQTRRKFTIDSAKITGAVIGTATLGKELLLPQTIGAANIQFPESNCGAKNKTDPSVPMKVRHFTLEKLV